MGIGQATYREVRKQSQSLDLLQRQTQYLLKQEWQRGFVLIDGHYQHWEFLSFDEWLKQKGLDDAPVPGSTSED